MKGDGKGEARCFPNQAWIAHTRPATRNMQTVYDVLTCKILDSTGMQVCKSMVPVGQGSCMADGKCRRTNGTGKCAIKRVEVCGIEEQLGVKSAILVRRARASGAKRGCKASLCEARDREEDGWDARNVKNVLEEHALNLAAINIGVAVELSYRDGIEGACNAGNGLWHNVVDVWSGSPSLTAARERVYSLYSLMKLSTPWLEVVESLSAKRSS